MGSEKLSSDVRLIGNGSSDFLKNALDALITVTSIRRIGDWVDSVARVISRGETARDSSEG